MRIPKYIKSTTLLFLFTGSLYAPTAHALNFVNSGVLVLDCYFRLPEGYFLTSRGRDLLWAGFDGGVKISIYMADQPLLDSATAVLKSTHEYKGYFIYEYKTDFLPATVITDKLNDKITVFGKDATHWKLFIDNCFKRVTDSLDLINNK